MTFGLGINTISVLCLALSALIHLLPLGGVLGARQLRKLYGMDFSDTNLALLMRHRAVLFGLIGGILLYSCIVVAARPLAITVGLVSVVSFLALARLHHSYSAAIRKIVIADYVALVLLLVAALNEALQPLSEG